MANPAWLDKLTSFFRSEKAELDDVLGETEHDGTAHWHVEYRVASEELFEIWARSTGTAVPVRAPGEPLPRMVLDGILVGEFDAAGLATEVRIWWHSMATTDSTEPSS